MLTFRIQHGLGQFSLGDFQSYHLIYESNNYCLKVIVTQTENKLDPQQQMASFKLFLDLMIYLEDSIHLVLNLYIPSAKFPVLHVCCCLCDVATPHIMLKNARKISPSLPRLCCAMKGAPKPLPRSSYLPFGDALAKQEISK